MPTTRATELAQVGSLVSADPSASTVTVSGSVVTNAGTAAAPAVVPTGDLNTGMFFPAADTIAFAEGGSEAMRIDSSGNVGIGNTNPNRKLDVRGSNAGGDFQALRLWNESANTSDSSTSIDIPVFNGTGGLRIKQQTSSSQNYDCSILTQQATASLILGSGTNTERLRIDSSGNLLVGTTSSGQTTGVGLKLKAGDANVSSVAIVYDTAGNKEAYTLYNANATNNGYRFYVTADGGINNFSANNVNLSDERLKTNINLAGNYLEKICSIPVRTFLYKDQGEDTEKTIGVIAQEVEAVIPELINNDGFGETPEDRIPLKTIYQTDFQYVLMRCIQEQQVIINELKAKVAALEAA